MTPVLIAPHFRLMFDENNIYNSEYTGIYSTTLTVTFYEATPSFPTPPSADLILPLSTLSTTESQMFSYPGASSTNVTIPEVFFPAILFRFLRNLTSAVAEHGRGLCGDLRDGQLG